MLCEFVERVSVPLVEEFGRYKQVSVNDTTPGVVKKGGKLGIRHVVEGINCHSVVQLVVFIFYSVKMVSPVGFAIMGIEPALLKVVESFTSSERYGVFYVSLLIPAGAVDRATVLGRREFSWVCAYFVTCFAEMGGV